MKNLNLNNIISELLQAVSQNPLADINEILTRKAAELGMETTTIEKIVKSNLLLDQISEEVSKLDSARLNDYKTLQDFIYEETDVILEDKGEQERNAITEAIIKSVGVAIN